MAVKKRIKKTKGEYVEHREQKNIRKKTSGML
jgi:hypothetical protein